MAVRYAVASGNWSNTAIWNGGTLPTSTDDVYANTFTVNIDQNVTVLSLRTISGTGVTAGGNFTCGITATIDCSSGTGIFASSTCLTLSHTTGSTVIYRGFVSNSTSSTGIAISITGAGGITNIIGAVKGSLNNNTIVFSASATLNITGTVGGNTTNAGISIISMSTFAPTINITGDVYGQPAAAATTSYGITGSGSPTITIVGNIYGGANTTHHAINCGGSISITGNVYANPGYAISGGNVTIVGSITASSYPALTGGNYILSGPFYSSATGVFPMLCSGTVKLTGITNNEMRFVKSSGGTTSLYSPDIVSGTPAASDVRAGTVYGGGSLTGTCSIPAAASVSYGVPVDNTVGTASLSPADVAAIIGKQISAAISTI